MLVSVRGPFCDVLLAALVGVHTELGIKTAASSGGHVCLPPLVPVTELLVSRYDTR